MTPHHGAPCWYELTTPDLAASGAFYGGLLGWQIADAGMEGFTYHLASAAGTMVAGLWSPTDPMPHFWLCYFAVADCDATVAQAVALGATVHQPPNDIPGTGRFAILGDPQGAGFGILQPLPGGTGGAFDQMKTGHGNWHELTTPDPAAALAFYGALFGWTQSSVMPMGELGDYHIIARQGQDIGGIMRPPAPGLPPNWLPYFGAAGIEAAIAQITASGGTILNGPMEVPGGAFIAQALDPQGAAFAVVGPK